jgi:hypothetical protein
MTKPQQPNKKPKPNDNSQVSFKLGDRARVKLPREKQ